MTDKQQPLTGYNPEWVARYGHPFKGWDAPRPTSKCLHCKGTGMADEDNECGFCYPDIVTLIRKDAEDLTLGQALGMRVEPQQIVDELERRDAELERRATEIRRLRAYVAALQEDRQMAGNQAAAMRAAGDQLHAWMMINATSSQQDREDFEVVLNAWEEARRG